MHLLLMSIHQQTTCVLIPCLCLLSSLRTKQKQPEVNLSGGRRARKPQTGLPKWDAPFERRRQRQPNGPSKAHIRGSPQLPRDPGYAAVRHGQEEGGLPGASEAEIPPSCLCDYGSPGKAAGAGQRVERGLDVVVWLGSHCLDEMNYIDIVLFILIETLQLIDISISSTN